jgi:hypothetical protein
MDNTIGRVVAVAGSQMTATLEIDALTEDPVRIGAMVKVRSAHLDVIGTIGTINAEGGGSAPRSLIVVDLLGRSIPQPRAGRSSAGALPTTLLPERRFEPRQTPI